eukprot:2629225-Amphidinium_carterae.1
MTKGLQAYVPGLRGQSGVKGELLKIKADYSRKVVGRIEHGAWDRRKTVSKGGALRAVVLFTQPNTSMGVLPFGKETGILSLFLRSTFHRL